MIEEAIRTWEMFRQGVIAELKNIPDEHLDYRPAPGARSVRELAVHIAASSQGFVDALLSESGSFAHLLSPKEHERLAASMGEARTKAEVIALLEQRGAEAMARLRGNLERLGGRMPTMKAEQSRLSGLWFAASHEMYHRGQLATYARALGVVPALTQMIAGR
jgi:uncharacterized damage-inducible protein DinB